MVKRQRDIFLASEADAWYRRNKAVLLDAEAQEASDPVLAAFAELSLAPRSVLEVGCSNGWRLAALRRRLGAGTRCLGVEPSPEAVADADRLYPGLEVVRGAADEIPFADAAAEAVIAGFFLYLCDRADLFRIACEMDRVLADKGVLAIYDYWTPVPYRNPYKHAAGVYSYKMDYAALFAWHPAYRTVYHAAFHHDVRGRGGRVLADDPDSVTAVTILRKDHSAAFPDNPYR